MAHARLRIHPKTLHYWLKQAHVPLAAHPTDARISCQAFAQKGRGVTWWCEPEVDKGNPMGQTEKRTVPLKSEQGGFLCNTITHLPHDEYGMKVDMPVCVS